MTDQIKITEQGGVLTLQLNRPDLRNAISDEMIETIVDTCDRINRDMSINCMVITGAGEGFCSGGDLKDMVTRTGHFAGPPIHARRVFFTASSRFRWRFTIARCRPSPPSTVRRSAPVAIWR